MNQISLSSIVNEAPIVAIVRRPEVDPARCIEHLFQHGIRFGVDALGLGGGPIPKSNDEFDQCAALAHQLLEIALKARDSR
jgi:hypothetical protein